MATAINIMQAWLDEAVALRADMLRSEVALYLFLLKGERGACPWQGQYTDFEQLLETMKLCSTQRYTAFRDAIDQVNDGVKDQMHTLGVDGIIEAGRIQAPAKRVEFVARVVEGSKNQGCPLSPRRILEIGQQIAPKTRPYRHPPDKSYEKLLKESAALRAENKRLKAANAKLTAQLKASRAKVRS